MDNFDSQRIIITELPAGLQITIRAGRAWQDILRVTLPGIILIIFGYFFIRGHFNDLMAVIVWGAFYCITLCFFLNRLWWMVAGRETITAGNGVLLIQRNVLLRIYNTDECPLDRSKDFSVDREPEYFSSRLRFRIPGMRGTIHFACDGGRQYSFGDVLSEAEGKYIIEQLRNKKLIN